MSQAEDIATMKARLDVLERDMAELMADVKAIRSRTDRWSGVAGLVAIAVPALLGGALGWFLKK